MTFKKRFRVGDSIVDADITWNPTVEGQAEVEWYGTGVSEKFIKIQAYETEIGTIRLEQIAFVSEDYCYEFTFKGIGKPEFAAPGML